VHGLFFPPAATDYVSAGNVYDLIAYGLLLWSIVRRTADDIALGAARSERLRLSRDLHDGLAQQLALLRLRPDRAGDLATPAHERARDLASAAFG
jgi:signal transduction histidine kinase